MPPSRHPRCEATACRPASSASWYAPRLRFSQPDASRISISASGSRTRRLIAVAAASLSLASSQWAAPSGTKADSSSVHCRYQRSPRSRHSGSSSAVSSWSRRRSPSCRAASLMLSIARPMTMSSPVPRASSSARSPRSSARSSWSRCEEMTDRRSSALVSAAVSPSSRAISSAASCERRPHRGRIEG